MHAIITDEQTRNQATVFLKLYRAGLASQASHLALDRAKTLFSSAYDGNSHFCADQLDVLATSFLSGELTYLVCENS